MNAEKQKLYDQKGKAYEQMKALGEKLKAEKRTDFTAEEQKQFDGWDAEIEGASKAIANLEKLEKHEKENAVANKTAERVNDTPEKVKMQVISQKDAAKLYQRSERGDKFNQADQEKFDFLVAQDVAFRKKLCGEGLTEEENAIVQTLRVNSKTLAEYERAQTVTTTGGGYTIPQGFLNDIIVYLKLVSPFFEEMKIGPSAEAKSLFYYLNTPTGNDLPCPAMDDTANTGELVAINTDIFTNTTDMVFSQITMKAYKYGPKPMKVPSELLQDTGIDLPGLIAETLGTRLGRIINTHFTTGDNSAKPQGIVAGASAGVVSAADNAVTFLDIIELVHSVDPAYRKSPFARFMLNDTSLKYLKKLTVGSSTNDSRPLWSPSYREGAPDTIDGFQYLLNQDMASLATDAAKAILFGDMKAYAIRQAGPFVMKFLGERFADIDQVAWLLLARMDGRYRNTSAIKYLEVS